MNDEIRDIINKSLPAQVGDVLRKRLTQADALEVQVKEKQQEIELQRDKIVKLEETKASALEILKREQALVANEAKLREKQAVIDKDEAVLKARTEMTNAMLAQNLQVVLAVFANNKLKYDERSTVPFAFANLPTPGNSFPSPQTTTLHAERQVEVQG
jgi:hypothetical protein